MSPRQSRIGSSLLLLGASMAIALLIAEAVLRVGFPHFGPGRVDGSNPFWQPDARLGWVHRPSSEGRFAARGIDVAVRINSRGLRGPEHEARPAGQRILLVGDSFAWGWGVEEPEGVAWRLADGLSGWEVINAGTAGYSTDQEYLWYLEEGARYQADVVVLLFCQNDFRGNVRTELYGYPKPRLVPEEGDLRLANVPVPERARWQRLRSWAKRSSHLVHALAAGRTALHTRAAGMPLDTRQLPLGPDESQATRAILTRFAAAVAADGRAFVWALVPTSDDRVSWLRALGGELGVPVIDLGPAFARAEAAGESLTLPYDPHWSAAGHAVASEALLAGLRPLLSAPAAAPSQSGSPR